MTTATRPFVFPLAALLATFVVVFAVGKVGADTSPATSTVVVRTQVSPAGQLPPHTRVAILDATTLERVATAELGGKGNAKLRVQPGTYDVCVAAPAPLRTADHAQAIGGWLCHVTPVAAKTPAVTFALAAASVPQPAPTTPTTAASTTTTAASTTTTPTFAIDQGAGQ